jgi:hypothetical protein
MVISMMVSGCVVLLAGAATGAGAYAYVQGRLSFTTSHSIGQCHDATLAALKSLDIRLVSDQTDKLASKIRGEMASGDAVVVDISPEAEHLTEIGIRVGYIGNKVHSERIAGEIKKRLR